MINKKIIKKENLFHNLSMYLNKKVCAMIKADAYGHGLSTIVKLLNDKVDYFGVANEIEGCKARKFTTKPILIVGKAHNLELCKKNNLEIMVDDKETIEKAAKLGLGMHLKINCGMNRFGISSFLSARVINRYLEDNKIGLKSIFCHFSNTNNRKQTTCQYGTFLRLRKCIKQDVPICFGGSNIVDYPFEFDMVRVGIGLYGYERKGLSPVMGIKSKVVKIFYVHKGEYVGYGKKYKVKKNRYFAIVPVGYGDGLFRALSGKFSVKIGKKTYKSVGNICMDMFFVKIDNTVKVGDEVVVFDDANAFSQKLNTISYEVLTNFSKIRADTIVE